MINYNDFLAVDIRVGKIVGISDFPEARKPAYRLQLDFGEEIGIKKSSAQLVQRYPDPQLLLGKKVIAVVNFPAKQVGKFMSEVLVLGVPDAAGHVILLHPDEDVPLGGRVF